MAVIYALKHDGREMGMTAGSYDKLMQMCDRALACLETMKKAGRGRWASAPTCSATNTSGSAPSSPSGKRQVLTPFDILHSATAVNAEILQQAGRLGVVKEGALADLLVVDGDPLANLDLLAASGENLTHIMAAGRLVKQPAAAHA